jgi:hypothetical protein
MKTCRLALAGLIVAALTASHAPSDDTKKGPPAEKTAPKEKAPPRTIQSKLMAEKLKHAQRLLDGLTTNDFTKIAASADALMLISKAAEFTAVKTPRYEVHTNNFRRALEEIAKKAKAKNLDGATLGYVDMTLTCVRCHQSTREERNTRAPTVPTGIAGRMR